MANSHDIVAHNWAHQTGKKCRGGNMFYDGNTIYSWGYHFPIATFLTAPNGEAIVLYSTERRSVSTSQHQTIVGRALGYDRANMLYVPFLDTNVSKHDALKWIERLDKDIEPRAGKWARARVYKDSHAASMKGDIETINRIIDLWQLDVPQRTMPEDIGSYIAASEERRKAVQRAEDLKDRETIKKWLQGEDVHPPHTRVPYVRVREHQVQTSWGIKVPLADALKLHRMAGLVRIAGKDWHPKKRHEIGGWKVDQISYDGTIRAGCHVIPFKVQQEAARLAGIDAATFHINSKQMETA